MKPNEFFGEKLLPVENNTQIRIEEILSDVKNLAAEYYSLTSKPLGVTGEIAEYHVAKIFDLELTAARTEGYDAIRRTEDREEKIQIKGRAVAPGGRQGQRMSRIKTDADCDIVMLILLNQRNYDPIEIWEADYISVVEALERPGSKSRARGALGISKFKSIGRRVWPLDSANDDLELSCPECGQVFRGTWGGIDAHWRARHDHIIPYEKAWPLIKNQSYKKHS